MLISRRFERKIMDKYITMPITEETTAELKAGDYVYLTGTMYVARDAAHKRMIEALDEGGELPIDIRDATIYYMGPSPAREGRPIGSAGPTTATRMDKYAPRLLDLGEKAMIGKGKRSKEVVDAVIRNHAVYFAAIGGAGALLSKCITKSEIVCYEDLGAEAIRSRKCSRSFPRNEVQPHLFLRFQGNESQSRFADHGIVFGFCVDLYIPVSAEMGKRHLDVVHQPDHRIG